MNVNQKWPSSSYFLREERGRKKYRQMRIETLNKTSFLKEPSSSSSSTRLHKWMSVTYNCTCVYLHKRSKQGLMKRAGGRGKEGSDLIVISRACRHACTHTYIWIYWGLFFLFGRGECFFPFSFLGSLDSPPRAL